jgi:6-phospho-beta-glucosidase
MDDQNLLPKILDGLKALGGLPGFDVDVNLVSTLGMLPNYYLRYYYHTRQTLAELQMAPETRGEEVARLNRGLFEALRAARAEENVAGLQRIYRAYLLARNMGHVTTNEQFSAQEGADLLAEVGGMGYATLALNMIEALVGGEPRRLVVNIPNRGSIHGMKDSSVVEIPALVSRDRVDALPVGEIPVHCLGLMQTVKAYEELTIDAAVERSQEKAITALTIHPLVQDYAGAKALVEAYSREHGAYYPELV